jgi:hypothetical protein
VGDFGGEMGICGTLMAGNGINGGELPFLSPTPRARSPFRAFLFRPESPSAPRKAGDVLGSPDGWKPKSGRKRGTGGVAGPNIAVRM